MGTSITDTLVLLSDVLHLAELSHLLDLVGVEEHQIFLLELHHPLVHLLVQLDVGVDEHGDLATNLPQVVDHLFHNGDVEPLFTHAC